MAMNPRLLRPKKNGFLPTNLTGLTLWLDAGDRSTFTFNGSTVSEWRSKAGVWKATQSTAANQPSRVTNFLTSRAAVRFTASTQALSLDATWADLGNNSTLAVTEFYLLQWPTGSNQAFIQEQNASTGHKIFAYFSNALSYYDAGSESTARVFGNVGSAVTTGVIITGQRNGGTVTLWHGNTQVATRTNATGNLNGRTPADPIQFVGAGGGNASLAEAIVYNRALSTDEITTVRLYLSQRYGL